MKRVKVAGIDIGGTSIKGIVIDEQGQILSSLKIDTESSLGRNHILENLKKIIGELSSVHQDLAGVGIGTAGRVNVSTGEVVYATANLPGWQGTNVKKIMEQHLNLPVMVDNDANAALLGEQWLGAGRDLHDITMLTLGTGVGGANLVNGNMFRGAHWSGGEWGHVILIPNGHPCNCGQNGCIEQYLSGNALVRFAKEATNEPYESGVKVMEDYQNNRKEIVSVIEMYIAHLSVVITNLANGLNPQAVIIGGGVIESKEIWWDAFLKAIQKNEVPVEVRPALLGNRAGSIGAAKLIIDTIRLNHESGI